jgi:serine/threonine protein kinase
MPLTNACPPRETLQQFDQGQLSPDEVERWAEHVEQCDHCLAFLHEASTQAAAPSVKFPGDTAALRENPLVLALIEQFERRPPEGPALAGAEDHDFLTPPRGPGEIGWLGPYRILKVLDSGGMNVVFQAEDPEGKRLLAIKTTSPGQATFGPNRRRFLREALAASIVRSEYIMPIFQSGECNGVPFLAMPFLQGCTLDARLRQGEPLSIVEIVRLGIQVARGLAAAHERGLIHRDIKPTNLWLEPEPGGRVKILNFGLARFAGDDVRSPRSATLVGSPDYTAPEQARGGEVDGRCDLFSLGCVLYRLLTGTGPMSTRTASAETRPNPPRSLNPSVPEKLSELVLRLLAEEPADRPQTATAVIESLETVAGELGGGLPPGEPTRPPVSARAGGRRLRWLVGAGVVLLAVAIAVLASQVIIHLAGAGGANRGVDRKPEEQIEVPSKSPDGQ